MTVNVAITPSQKDKWVIPVDLCSYQGSIAEYLDLTPERIIHKVLTKLEDTVNRHRLRARPPVYPARVRTRSIPKPFAKQKESASSIGLLFEKPRKMIDCLFVDLSFPSADSRVEIPTKHDVIITVTDFEVGGLPGVNSTEKSSSGVSILGMGFYDTREFSSIVPSSIPVIFSNLDYLAVRVARGLA